MIISCCLPPANTKLYSFHFILQPMADQRRKQHVHAMTSPRGISTFRSSTIILISAIASGYGFEDKKGRPMNKTLSAIQAESQTSEITLEDETTRSAPVRPSLSNLPSAEQILSPQFRVRHRGPDHHAYLGPRSPKYGRYTVRPDPLVSPRSRKRHGAMRTGPPASHISVSPSARKRSSLLRSYLTSIFSSFGSVLYYIFKGFGMVLSIWTGPVQYVCTKIHGMVKLTSYKLLKIFLNTFYGICHLMLFTLSIVFTCKLVPLSSYSEESYWSTL